MTDIVLLEMFKIDDDKHINAPKVVIHNENIRNLSKQEKEMFMANLEFLKIEVERGLNG